MHRRFRLGPGDFIEVVTLGSSGLLLRPELAMAASSPAVAASLRALCLEHLERRPPVEEAEPSEPDLQ